MVFIVMVRALLRKLSRFFQKALHG